MPTFSTGNVSPFSKFVQNTRRGKEKKAEKCEIYRGVFIQNISVRVYHLPCIIFTFIQSSTLRNRTKLKTAFVAAGMLPQETTLQTLTRCRITTQAHQEGSTQQHDGIKRHLPRVGQHFSELTFNEWRSRSQTISPSQTKS